MIETARLTLRPWTLDDIPAAIPIYGDHETMRLYGHCQSWTPEDVERVIRRHIDLDAQHGQGPWAIVRRDTGALIGHCGLEWWDDTQEIELCYVIARAHWGLGFATEATRAVVDEVWAKTDLGRIAAVVYPGNGASEAVLHKLGFRLERRMPLEGQDAMIYGLTRPGRPV